MSTARHSSGRSIGENEKESNSGREGGETDEAKRGESNEGGGSNAVAMHGAMKERRGGSWLVGAG